jgi:polyisoprenoid-binding protein YceI
VKTSIKTDISAGLCLVLVAVTQCLATAELRAESDYIAKAGKIEFTVDSNVPFLKVTGSSSDLKGGGEAAVQENTVVVRNLEFEVDPKTFKTGLELRDQHLYEKVFTASDGSIPRIVLRAGEFQAAPNGKPDTWEGNLKGELTMRGVTKPVSFRASLHKKGDGAVVNAEGTIKTSAFGVKEITYSGATVSDEVTVTVSNLRVAP